jgi:exodeoxyribonuclease-3
MMSALIATWNINSVRLRINRVTNFLRRVSPDVLCLQEIKCQSGEFPHAAFEDAGYPYRHVVGQKGMHGVAIVSRLPLEAAEAPDFCRHGHARVAAASAGGIDIHCLYVPAGADTPDPAVNEKFAHKLDFLDRMEAYYSRRARSAAPPLLVAGDINIAPGEHDVWSHRQLLDVVSHTPVETEAIARILADGALSDVARLRHSADEKLYSWWSYRAADWRSSNRGRRLDHIWADARALPAFDIGSFAIHAEERDGDKPSDHVPVCVRMSL